MQLRYTYNNVESTWGGNIQQLLSWPRDKQITVISSLVRDRNKAWVTFNSERRRREFEVTMTRYYLTPRQDTQQTGETGESSDFVLKQALEGFGLKMSSTNEEYSCGVCLESVQDMNKNAMLRKCGHVFHTSCLEQILEHSGNNRGECPYCKVQYFRDNIYTFKP